jgi:hypothetical protein
LGGLGELAKGRRPGLSSIRLEPVNGVLADAGGLGELHEMLQEVEG